MKQTQHMICAGPCKRLVAKAKDGNCPGCRMRLRHAASPLDSPLPMNTALQHLYRGEMKKATVSAGLDEISRRFGVPRSTVTSRAHSLGLRMYSAAKWSLPEEQLLEQLLGELSYTRIAKRLKTAGYRSRTARSVKQKAFAMGLTNEQATSYSLRQLEQHLGMSHGRIASWVARGFMFFTADRRITDDCVALFLWKHMDLYRFGRADEPWLKRMLFEGARLSAMQTRREMRRAA